MRTDRLALRVATLCLTLLVAAGPALAEAGEPMKIWPNGAPDEKGNIGAESSATSAPPRAVTRISNVTEPTITVYRPAADKANGCTVVICPGGGYSILAYDLEGTEVAEWLNSVGVTAVLLKYRVPRRDNNVPHVQPLQDAQRAIRLTRKNAKAWGVDPSRIGVLGFSAGGHLTVMAGTHYDEQTYPKVDDADELSCRPDFLVPIYAAYLSDKKDSSKLDELVRVTKDTPQTFLAVTQDDATRGTDAALLFVELTKNKVPAEVHVFTKGGHGYGLRPSDNPVSGWPKLCEEWMRSRGLLKMASDK